MFDRYDGRTGVQPYEQVVIELELIDGTRVNVGTTTELAANDSGTCDVNYNSYDLNVSQNVRAIHVRHIGDRNLLTGGNSVVLGYLMMEQIPTVSPYSNRTTLLAEFCP